jgi:ABC-type polysaccharide/polyol phosphate export permease
MFYRPQPKTLVSAALNILELIYHATVRAIRKGHRNALAAIAINIFQSLLMVGIFFLMMSVFGVRSSGIRGDFLLYIMSGVLLYMGHIRTVASVTGAGGPTSAMMLHAPMNTVISIMSAALSALYIQVISVFVILVMYNTFFNKIYIDYPVGALSMLLLAWLLGVAVGMIFMALKLWLPTASPLMSQVYIRVNMIASGKLFVANTMPGYMLVFFDWNPLFHLIDQTRGFVFNNYFPHHSSIEYPMRVI